MYDSDDDADLDRLLAIDEEIQTENVPPQPENQPVVLPAKRTLDLDNSSTEASSTLSEAKRRKSIFVENTSQMNEASTSLSATTSTVPELGVLHKRIPLEGDYVSITFSQGRRYYLKEYDDDADAPVVAPPFESNDLAEEVKRSLRLKNERPPQDFDAVENVRPNSSALWTTKYAPNNYLDLISDESTNRTLLRWIKAWDHYVFGSPIPAEVQTSTASTGSATNQPTSRMDDLEKLAGELDPRDRLPRYRLVLLAGCPGLGKTTLAHLLAQHAGYQVIEVNASDDRTVSAFKDQLTAIVSSTTSLNSVSTGADPSRAGYKPCCLILDEIDGAAPAAVELLASAAKCNLPSGGERRSRGRRNVTPLVLRRPVICICNDLFATSVRPLRAPGVPCLVLRLPCVDLGRLTSRLDFVARKEGLPTEKIVLTQLAEMADRDIRACLNALQFLKSHLAQQASSSSCVRHISADDLATMTRFGGGLKDVQRSLFDVWKAVFTIPPPHVLSGCLQRRVQASRTMRTASELRNLKKGRLATDSESTLTARLDYLMEIVASAGDAQPMTMGIFENYLNCRMKDSSLNVARQASGWFLYHDLLFRHIRSHADYSLLRYISHLPAWFHLTLATPLGLSNISSQTKGKSGLQWPTAHTEANTKRQQCVAILDQLLANQWATPGTHGTGESARVTSSFRFLPRRRFLMDVAPSTLSLLSLTASSLRPLNAQLYSQQETIHLANLVGIMLNLGLDFSPQQNTETGEVELHLDPGLDQIVCFGDNSNAGLRNTPHTTKQLIARELAIERMRRTARNANVSFVTPNAPNSTTKSKESPKLAHDAVVSMPLGSSAKSKAKVKCDFFGRPITETRKSGGNQQKAKENDVSSESSRLINQALYYRFREGYSNAVRRPVTMKHFL